MNRLKKLKKHYFFYILPIPGIICLILFSYIPMAGLYMIFEKFYILSSSEKFPGINILIRDAKVNF